MRKILTGFVFGVILTLSLPVLASNMVGKKIDAVYPVTVDGTMLSKSAVSIEGTSYLPVRTLGETLGYDVDFENNQVLLTKEEASGISSGTSTVIGGGNMANDTIKATASYPIKTNIEGFVLWDDDVYKLVSLDGTEYMLLRPFGKYCKYVAPNAVFKFPNENYTIIVDREYSPGIEGFQAGGKSYIRLSAIGLKAKVQDNTIIIDKL